MIKILDIDSLILWSLYLLEHKLKSDYYNKKRKE